MCDINLFHSYYIISARSMCFFFFLAKMSKFRFDTMMVLCEMCLSISVWMPTKICVYTCYYIPFLNDLSFHHWQKLCKSNWRAKSVSTSNIRQSSSYSFNCHVYDSYLVLFDFERSKDFFIKAHSIDNNKIYMLLNWCFYSFKIIIAIFL